MTIYYGTSGNDDFTGANRGTPYSDSYYTYGGDDRIDSNLGDDYISSAEGFDTIYAGEGDDHIYGGVNDDIIYGDLGNDWINGDGGNDIIWGGQEDDQLYGGDGNDVFMHDGLAGWDAYTGDADTDAIRIEVINAYASWGEIKISYLNSVEKIENLDASGRAVDILMSGSLNLSAVKVDGIRSVIGSSGNDSITGTSNLSSYSLNDMIDGRAGNDFLYGGTGNDVLKGGDGTDWLDGGSGNDTMQGGAGDDVYVIDAADDVVTEDAIAGTDRVESDVTTTLATNVENLLLTGSGAVNGVGNALANSLTGNIGDNSLTGGDGADVLFGDAGNDTLLGGIGDDALTGGTGIDTFTGGTGADRFVFTENVVGTDRIMDFNQLKGGAAEGDFIVLQGLLVGTFDYVGTGAFTGGSNNSEARISGTTVLIDTNGNGAVDIRITLTGLTSASQLDESSFLWT